MGWKLNVWQLIHCNSRRLLVQCSEKNWQENLYWNLFIWIIHFRLCQYSHILFDFSMVFFPSHFDCSLLVPFPVFSKMRLVSRCTLLIDHLHRRWGHGLAYSSSCDGFRQSHCLSYYCACRFQRTDWENVEKTKKKIVNEKRTPNGRRLAFRGIRSFCLRDMCSDGLVPSRAKYVYLLFYITIRRT